MLQTHGVSGTEKNKIGAGYKMALQLFKKSAHRSIHNPPARAPLTCSDDNVLFVTYGYLFLSLIIVTFASAYVNLPPALHHISFVVVRSGSFS